MPSICHVSAPYLDDRGFWLDVDIDYSGGFCLSMETKCNLMRLKYASCMSASAVNEESTVKLARFVGVVQFMFDIYFLITSAAHLALFSQFRYLVGLDLTNFYMVLGFVEVN